MERGKLKLGEMLNAQMTAHVGYADRTVESSIIRFARGEQSEGGVVFNAPVDRGDGVVIPNFAMLTDHAFGQVCGRFDMPYKYIKTLPPHLSVPLFNYGNDEHPASYFLRYRKPEDATVRAWLSDKYTPLDNTDVLGVLAGIESEKGGDKKLRVFESYSDPDEFYFKWLLDHTVNLDGEHFHIGVVIGNSEIGTRSASCEPFLYRDACENGIIYGYRSWSDAVYRKRHIHATTEELYVGMAKALERAFGLLPAIEAMIKAAKARAVSSLDSYLNELVGDYGIGQKEATEIKERVVVENPGGASLWNVVNGITATAKSADVDRQLEMERIGGEILAKLVDSETSGAATMFARN